MIHGISLPALSSPPPPHLLPSFSPPSPLLPTSPHLLPPMIHVPTTMGNASLCYSAGSFDSGVPLDYSCAAPPDPRVPVQRGHEDREEPVATPIVPLVVQEMLRRNTANPLQIEHVFEWLQAVREKIPKTMQKRLRKNVIFFARSLAQGLEANLERLEREAEAEERLTRGTGPRVIPRNGENMKQDDDVSLSTQKTVPLDGDHGDFESLIQDGEDQHADAAPADHDSTINHDERPSVADLLCNGDEEKRHWERRSKRAQVQRCRMALGTVEDGLFFVKHHVLADEGAPSGDEEAQVRPATASSQIASAPCWPVQLLQASG